MLWALRGDTRESRRSKEEEGMRKRIALVATTLVMALSLLLPGTAAAASYGKIANTGTTCKNGGAKVVASFKLTKYSGFHATKLIMDAYGQGYYSGGWRNDYYIGRWYVNIDTSGGYYMTQSFYYVDGQSGSSRIKVYATIKNGSTTLAKGNAHSAFCG
jgi:hypothetical protein